MQLESAAFIDHGMPGIVATAIADHDMGLPRQPIDNVSFAFIAPLGSN
jgi:hypothetical protein